MKLRFLFSLMVGGALAASAQGYQDGVDNYNADRFDIAKEILTNTLNSPSTDKAVSYYYLGNIAFKDKDYAAAKSNYEKGYEVNPNYVYNIIGLGQSALQAGNKDEAKKYFDQAMKLDKKNTAVIANVARAYWNVDPVAYAKDIKKLIEKAFKESKNTEPAVYMLQGDMAAKEDPGVAAGQYEMAIEQDKAKGNVNREAYVKYAHVYDVHNRPLVIEKLEELNELEPTSGLAQRELAEQYYSNQQFDKAWKSYEKYVQNPNHFRIDEQRYAGLLFSAKQYDESIKWANNVLKQDANNPYMYRLLMLNYNALENDSLATVYGDRLFATPNVDLGINDYVVYGNALIGMNRGADAVAVFEKGIAAFPDEDRAKNMIPMLSKAYRAAGDNDKAIATQMAYLDSGAASHQDYFTMYSNYLDKARKAEKGSAEATENFNNALKYLNMAIEKVPNHYYYYYQKGILSYMMNDNKVDAEAAEALETMLDKLAASSQAVQDGAKDFLPSAYTLLTLYYSKIDKDKAIEYARKGLEIAPENGTLQSTLAELEK